MITEPSSPGRAGTVYSVDRIAALWGNPKSNRGKSVEPLYAIFDVGISLACEALDARAFER